MPRKRVDDEQARTPSEALRSDPRRDRSPGRNSFLAAFAGSVVPAFVGVVATLFAVSSLSERDASAILVIWTVVGYLTLTDLGLTRSAAAMVAVGAAPADAARALRPVSLTAGAMLSVGLYTVLHLWRGDGSQVPELAILVIAPLPVLTTLTFPLMGSLEAVGRFGLIAAHKSLQSVTTYLLPPLLVAAGGLEGMVPAVLLILGYRGAALIVLWTALRGVGERPGSGSLPRTRHLVTWIGLSSVVGPLMLYLDRAFLPSADADDVWWVFYVGLSELMLKSYVVPASVMSVLFPWTARTISAAPSRVRSLYLGRILPACVALCVLGAVVVATVPARVLERIGMPAEEVSTGRVIAAVFVSLTVLNWSSQAFIGVLQVTGSMQWVASAQVILVAPFLAALALAATAHSVAGLVAVWGARIFLFWAMLLVRITRDLRVLEASGTNDIWGAERTRVDNNV